MLTALVKTLLKSQPTQKGGAATIPGGPLRLHIGGKERHPDWRIVNVTPGEAVDYVRSCTDLSPFADSSAHEIYASHVLEHLGYAQELKTALKEFNRVLVPGGTIRASVPDLTTLCALFLDPALDLNSRFHVMRMMYGGQVDAADYHLVGLSEEFLAAFLKEAGFADIQRVEDFGLFNDTSRLKFAGRLISLNLVARKPG